MTRKKITIAAAIVAAIFAFKACFPGTAAAVIEKGRGLFSRDIDYRRVLTDIGDAVPAFLSGGGRVAEKEPDEAVAADLEVEQGSVSVAELLGEEASNLGEEPVFPETEIPPAVAAFLESQERYSDVELPENVSYSYEEFPEENSLPVVGYNSSGFGYRTHPIHGDLRFHYGTDFAAWSGENIYAFADGTVSFAGYSESYGNYITIDHAEGWQSLYAHCSILYVNQGDSVKAGERIALVGATGIVTGPHLHFELMHEGIYTNPEYYVN